MVPIRSGLRYTLVLALAALVLAVVPTSAQQAALEIDPARTTVHYTLSTSLHTVHGTFKLKSGKADLDLSTGKASGLIVIDAASGESGNNGRDSKMHKEILESQKYPEIRFTPGEVEGHVEMQGDSQVEVKGTFSLHGQDHEFVIPAAVHIAGSELTLDMSFSIPYIKWGLKNPSTFILRASDRVELSIHAIGRWTSQTATN
jgi:polyisoprenoid-binding protein YceI